MKALKKVEYSFDGGGLVYWEIAVAAPISEVTRRPYKWMVTAPNGVWFTNKGPSRTSAARYLTRKVN